MATLPTPVSNIPVPDPSVVTQQIIDKAEARWKEALDTTVGSVKRELIVRIEDMDKAAVVLAENVNRVPTLLDREVARVVEMIRRSEQLSDEKFGGIARQIKERDIQAAQEKTLGAAAVIASVEEAEVKAQTANDALERLLESNMEANATLANDRFESSRDAIAKVNDQLALARTSALAATDAVDGRSQMRTEAAVVLTRSSEDKTLAAVDSLRQMVDLRARASEVAIDKANEATELRFGSINVLLQTINTRLATTDSKVSGLDSKILVGGSSIAIVLLVAQLVLGFHSSSTSVPTQQLLVPAVADNTKRVDDLISRLDAMQRNGQWVPPTPTHQ